MPQEEHAGPETHCRDVVVAGVAGGVGTTTVAALIGIALARTEDVGSIAAPMPVILVDHDDGDLVERAGPLPMSADSAYRVRCLGAHALNPQAAHVGGRGVVTVIVAPWHADGIQLAAQARERLSGPGIVVLSDVTRARPRGIAIGIPWDRALAVPGPVFWDSLSPRAMAAAQAIAVEVGTVGMVH